ncbi:hypothetical protein GGR51DRAFT_575810 [Nemania sp. FL0031]|nr:hypothetical protein GGR51DRAFT_575810 [Nemania sp. FL0031]
MPPSYILQIVGGRRRSSSHHHRSHRPHSSSQSASDNRSHHSSSRSSTHHRDDHHYPPPPRRNTTAEHYASSSMSSRDERDHYTSRGRYYYDPSSPPGVERITFQSFGPPRRSYTDPAMLPRHPGRAPSFSGPLPSHPGPPPRPGPDTTYYQTPGSTYSRASTGHHTSGSQRPSHGGDTYYYNPPPGGHAYRPYTPPRVINEDGIEVIRPTSIWEPDSENEASGKSGPDPLLQTEEAPKKGKTDEQPLKDVEPGAPDKPASDYLREFREAQEKGKTDEGLLKFTINVVLLHEWYMEDGVLTQHPPDHFEIAIKVIPVRYIPNRNGPYRPVRNRKNEWGIVTDYTPEYNIYLAAILIRVPMTLDRITPAMIRSTYDRFAFKIRTPMLEEIDIPFRDYPDYRKYAMVFQFEGGDAPTQLYSAYLADDAVIAIPRRVV